MLEAELGAAAGSVVLDGAGVSDLTGVDSCLCCGVSGRGVSATDGVAESMNELERKAAAITALLQKKDFILLGSPSEVKCLPFSGATRELGRFRDSTSGSRSQVCRQPEWGCILDAVP